MKHRVFLTAILMVAMAITTNTVAQNYDFSAVAPTGQTLYYKITSDSTVAITCPDETFWYTAWDGYTKPTGDITIPSSVTYNSTTYSVTSIGDFAFYGCEGLTGSLTIPNSITSIMQHSFEGCSGFTGSLIIPNSVTSIDEFAFYYCSGFTGSLTIPNSVTSIGEGVFSLCSGFNGPLTIPNSVTTIGRAAFWRCTGLTSLNIGNSVTSIGAYAFSCDSSLSGALVIPNTVTLIDTSAFVECSRLSSLSIGNSVAHIGYAAFSGCRGITGALTIPNSVTTIGEYAFWSCTGLTSLNIGNSVTSIGAYAFSCDSSLSGALVIPNSVTLIDTSAFWGCSRLSSLTLGNSVAHIGRYAFSGCRGLTGALTIPNSVTSIEYMAFYRCSGLSSLTIGNHVNEIGPCAFYYCRGFTGSLTIPNSVTTIGNSAFAGCSGFNGALYISNSVTHIGRNAFYKDSLFTSLTLSNSITVIDTATFYGCSGFTGSLTIPSSVTQIGYGAFYGCRGFTGSLTIPNSVNIIADFAFYGCSGFNGALSLPNSVTSIGVYAFHGCSSFTGSLIIPNSVTHMGARAFAYDSLFTSLTLSNHITVIDKATFINCSGLTGSLSIPNSVTTIDNYAFYKCNRLTSVNIPSSVTFIGTAALADWWDLATVTVDGGNSVYDSRDNCNAIIKTATNTLILGCQNTVIPQSVTAIGQQAFDECIHLSSITIPSSVASIGSEAFWGCTSLASFTLLAVAPPALETHVFDSVDSTIPIYVPCGSVTAYRAANGWSNFSNIQGIYDSHSIETDTACNSYTWHGRTFTASTDTATYTTTNAAGCDSTVTLNLTLNYSSSASETDTACNSYLWNNHGNSGTFTSSGTYFSSYYTPEGCLSVDTLNLTVNYSTSGAETVTACNSYTWHGRAFSASTDTATYRTTNAAGCDSTATLHLTINQCSTTETTACDSYTWHGTAYTSSGTYTSGTDTLVLTINHSTTGTETVTACNSYTWNGRAFSASTDTATYRTTNAAGCDSTATLHLSINQCSTTETTACDSYTWHGTAYTSSGTYTSGTDTLVLTINHSTIGTETDTACNSYTWHGRAFSVSTDTATYHTTNAAGCDSTATLHLTIFYDSNMVYTVNDTDSYTWANHGTTTTYTESGTYTNSYTTAEGCAGIDTLHLTITPSPHTQYYTVSALSANASMGRASVEGNSQVEEGNTATVRATANNGYFFVRWSNGATANPYTFTVTQDTVLTATFATRSYMVTVVNGNPGRGIVSGTGMAQHGARHNVSAAPNYGYRFSHWSDGDSNASRTITVTGDITLTAYFGVRQFHIGVAPANYAQGTVTGSGDYDYMSTATIQATPANGYEFDHWSDGDTINPRRITVTRDSAFTATFREVPVIPTYTVTATSANTAMGSVTGGGSYEEGTVATLTARANDGYEFVQWTDGVTANPRNITVLSDTVFTATFREVYVQHSYTVTLASNDNSIGRVSGGGTYDEGATAHIGAYPSAHCRFVRWSDGNTNAQRTITVNGNLSLTAFFARDSVNITVRANDDRMGRVTGGGSYAYGSEATLTATPLSGYRFVCWSTGERTSSITVTVRNATSYTAFFESTTQGIDEASDGEVRAWSHAMTIHVSGLTAEPVKVYDVTGRLIAERTNATGTIAIPVAHPGLYLVQTGTTTHKVLTR